MPDVLVGPAVATSSVGEMQISSTGTRMLIANTKTASVGEVKLYQLSADHQTLTEVGTRSFTGSARSVEFTDNDVSVFYTLDHQFQVDSLQAQVIDMGLMGKRKTMKSKEMEIVWILGLGFMIAD